MKNSTLIDLITSNSEVVIDSVLSDGLLKDIPIISNLVGVYHLKTTISDKIFYNKIVQFYRSFSDVESSSFLQWKSWANENIEDSEKLGTALVLHLDSLNELTKCKLTGHVFKKLIEGKLTMNEFEGFTYIISISSLSDLRKHCIESGDIALTSEESISQRLQFVGFYCYATSSLNSLGDGIPEYEITDKGCKFIELFSDFEWTPKSN